MVVPIVSAIGLVKQVDAPEGALTILDGVDLAMEPAEAVAIVGASGSGKSTLLSLLAGLDLPTAGQVRLDGTDLATLSEDGRAALRGRCTGFVFQAFHLIPTLTALENVMLPLELANSGDARARATRTLAEVGLSGRLSHTAGSLSGGEQQRVAIARAIVTGPRVIFADEPTGNLDARTGGAIIDLLFAVQREHRSALVLATHDSVLAARCHRVLHLADGRLAA